MLADRQTNDPNQRKLALIEVVLRNDQLLLSRLQFNLRTQRINSRGDTSLLQVCCLLVERLGSFNFRLCCLDTRQVGNHLKVFRAYGENNQFARISVAELSGFQLRSR